MEVATARELGNTFVAMRTGSVDPVTLWALKNAIGEFYHQFSGQEQQDPMSTLCSTLPDDIRDLG